KFAGDFGSDRYQVGTFCQPGNGPMSSLYPVAEDLSGMARRFVSSPSFDISASCGNMCSGGLDKSGIGQRRTSFAVADAIQRPSGETVADQASAWCPRKRCGS